MNALEINKYVQINYGTQDATVLASSTTLFPSSDWALEGGDPCFPVPWTRAKCSLDAQPRVTAMEKFDRAYTSTNIKFDSID